MQYLAGDLQVRSCDPPQAIDDGRSAYVQLIGISKGDRLFRPSLAQDLYHAALLVKNSNKRAAGQNIGKDFGRGVVS